MVQPYFIQKSQKKERLIALRNNGIREQNKETWQKEKKIGEAIKDKNELNVKELNFVLLGNK